MIKLTGDPAFERLRARGVVAGDVDAFQRAAAAASRPRRSAGSATGSSRRADHVFTPSGVPARPRDRLGRRSGPRQRDAEPCPGRRRRPRRATSFAARSRPRRPDARVRRAADRPEVARRDARRGRRRVPASSLLVAGDGEERDALVAGIVAAAASDRPRAAARAAAAGGGARRVRRRRRLHPLVELGELPAQRRRVARRRHAGDRDAAPAASRRSSRTASTGCSSPSATRARSAAAVRRYFDDEGLRERLRANAASSVGGLPPRAPPRRGRRADARVGRAMKPRVLFVARTRYALPLSETLQRRFDALSEVMEWRQLGDRPRRRRVSSDDRFTLVPPLPGRLARRRRLLRAAPRSRVARDDPVVPARRRDRPGRRRTPRSRSSARGSRRARRPDRLRRPRRLAQRHARVRLAGAAAAQPGRRPARATRGAPRRRRPHGLRLHDRASCATQGVEPTATFPAYMDLAPVPRHRPRAVPARAAGAVRRRPRALQGGRRARRGVADASPHGVPAAEPADRRARAARGARRGLVAEPELRVRWTPRLRDGRGRARARRGDAARAARPAARGWDGSSSRRSAAAAPSSGPDAGGIPDLVERRRQRAARAGRRRRCARRRRSSGCSTDRGLRGAARRGRARRRRRAWSATPEEFAARMRELVERVIATEP